MIDPRQTVRTTAPGETISTFEWRGLHLHVVTLEPLPADQFRTIEQALAKVKSVGQFADVVGIVLGRHVRIRTERPSPDVRLEVGK
jgi:muramoyltetrapeptide carboxypeptidase LdcA involved in peptidoglycan recycling